MAPACLQEVEDSLQSMPLDWAEEVENSILESLDEQEGREDQSVSDFIKEAEHLASFQDTSNLIFGHSYRPHVLSDCKLRLVRVRMLQDWL